MQDRTLFVIDDENGIRVLLKEVFGRSGFNVHVFEDPIEAHHALTEIHPDVVLIDYRIPKMRGDQFAEIVQQEGHYFPIILMTGDSKSVVERQITTKAITEIIEKPFNITDVVQTVNHTLLNPTK